ncbi:MAG: hypothetical protein ACOH5I_15585 [Oligoflexus sp.]
MAKRNHILRPQRFFAYEDGIQLIAKNRTSRFSCFWMIVNDLSKTGLGVSYVGRGILPVRANDILLITLDMTCKIFDRPLHLTCEVVRVSSEECWQGEPGLNRIFLGLKIIDIQQQHIAHWDTGLRKCGNPDSYF